MSQCNDLITLMKRQWITPLTALTSCGCLNFGGRVCEIRRMLIGSGLEIISEWRQFEDKRVKAFRITAVKTR